MIPLTLLRSLICRAVMDKEITGEAVTQTGHNLPLLYMAVVFYQPYMLLIFRTVYCSAS